jgi:hypothetical protein
MAVRYEYVLELHFGNLTSWRLVAHTETLKNRFKLSYS